ncbi:hypothetical protein [Orrella sp. 11846]|uniref:hypothetical protein n=1 Tax=Orrella sp. 11846 TaxID=3409913 RepID=UPI003B5CD1F7
MANPKKPTKLKVVAGTDRPDRHGADPIDLPLVDEIPESPSWMPNRFASDEWDRLARILHANGLLTEAGLGPLAMLCALHGKIVQLWMAGETPTGHLLAQYRALVGEFGLTPVAQGKVRPAERSPTGNAFANNGRQRKSS